MMICKMMYESGFKIRKKADVEEVLNKVLNRDTFHSFIVHDRVRIELYQEKGKWVADYGWIDDEWTSLRMEISAFDVVWKYRKFINAQWFSEKV